MERTFVCIKTVARIALLGIAILRCDPCLATDFARPLQAAAKETNVQPARAIESAFADVAPPQLVAVATAEDSKQVAAQMVAEAAALLDQYAGDWTKLQQAEAKLRQALEINPDEAGAYVELARYTMKAAGQLDVKTLDQSEQLLRRAIVIAPTFGNAYVLLGYVLTHQRRLKEADEAFANAEKYKATSPWLEFNVAELRDNQGQRQQAAQSFMRIASSSANPISMRTSALQWLEQFYVGTRQFEQADVAYKTEIGLRPNMPWPKGNYSYFLRVHRLDLVQSERFAREALLLMDYGMARQSLAMTLYLQWADALLVEENGKRAELVFAEANRLDPNLSMIVMEAGNYPRAHPILYALSSKGISVDSMPGVASATTPLTVAATRGNHAIAAEMIQLGANPNTQGYEGGTPLMIAAREGDEAMLRLLLTAGADPTLLSTGGKDAEQFAKDQNQVSAANLLASAKRTYIRPADAITASVPFRVRHVYQVRKDVAGSDRSNDLKAGQQVTFYDHFIPRDTNRAGFRFVALDGTVKEFSIDKKDLASWSEYFKEIGAVPSFAGSN